MMFAGQVLKHPTVASGLAFPRQSDQPRYVGQISPSVEDCGHRYAGVSSPLTAFRKIVATLDQS